MTVFSDARELVAEHVVAGGPRSITVAEIRAILDKILDAIAERALTSALTPLVATADIVDDLASTSADQPLSANQGRALKALIDGLGDVIVVADLTAAGALTGLDKGDIVHVTDNGAAKWVRYQITAAGSGTWATATKIVYWTQDQAPASHQHIIGDVTGLQTALDGKQALAALLTSLAGLSVVAGDLIYGSGVGTVSRLAKGSDGQVLKLASGVPAWAAETAAGVASFNTRTGAVTLGSDDVTGALGFTPVNKAGDTLTGRILMTGSGYVVDPDGVVLGRYDSLTGYVQAPAGGKFEVWRDDTLPIASFNDDRSLDVHVGPIRVADNAVYHAGNPPPAPSGVAYYNTQTGSSDLTYPVGTGLFVDVGSEQTRNATAAIYLGTGGRYSLSVSGTALTGTWRNCGGASGYALYQRVA